eukprot:3653320-Amphidinium_carterae.1
MGHLTSHTWQDTDEMVEIRQITAHSKSESEDGQSKVSISNFFPRQSKHQTCNANKAPCDFARSWLPTM